MEDTNSPSCATPGVTSVSFQNIQLETIFITAEGDVSLREAKTGLKDDHWGDFFQFMDKSNPIIWVRKCETPSDLEVDSFTMSCVIKGFPTNFRGLKFERDKKLHSKLSCSSKFDILFKDPQEFVV